MIPASRHNRIITISLAIFAAGCLAALFFFNPANEPLAPKCPVYTMSGFLCPGCGSQRMAHALLHGDLRAAWNFNAFIVASLPVIILYIFGALSRRRFPKLYNFLNSLPVIGLICLAIVLWTVGRNLL